jgi:hypothetical protein
MDVSAHAVSKVPQANLVVPRSAFGALWALAERLGGQPGAANEYLVGVVLTCRWLAAQPVWSDVSGRSEMPRAPVTGRPDAAMPETVETEYLAAASWRAPQRERARGVVATLDWAWHGSGQPPLDASVAAAS